MTQPITTKLLPGRDETFDEESIPSLGMVTAYRPSDKTYTIRSDNGDEFEMAHSTILWPNQTIVEVIGLKKIWRTKFSGT